MATAPLVLVVDDDLEIRRLLGRYLESQSLRVALAASRREMDEKLATTPVDIIVLDVMLPDGSGLDICREMGTRRPHPPIILLTALKEDVDRIIGLELGADDYLGKPFNPRELVARIRAACCGGTPSKRRRSPCRAIASAEFIADAAQRSVTDATGSEVDLTAAEFDLLLAFLDRPGPRPLARSTPRPHERPRRRSLRPVHRRACQPAPP